MLIPVILSGFMAKQFGKRFDLDVSSPREAVRALCSQITGFEQAILAHPHGFRVWADKEPLPDAESLDRCTGARAIRIVPVVAGAKNGLGMVIVGAALVWASGGLAAYGYAGLAGASAGTGAWAVGTSIGVSLVLGGISQMLTQAPKAGLQASNASNLLFSGAVNTAAQGNAIPICYGGPLRVGSQVIAAGIESVQMPSASASAWPTYS